MKKRDKILFSVLLVIFLFAAGYFLYYYAVLGKNEEMYEELAEESRITEAPVSAAPTVTEAPQNTPVPTEAPKADIPIDFEKLKKENPDIYAWIQIPGTKVDYPIVQSSSDDAYYLNHTVAGAEGYPGSIYTESLNKKDFSDKNTVIYGHNMKDGTMFGGLDQYVDPSFMNEHGEVIVYTPEHMFTYQVFAAVTYDDRHILKSFDCNEEGQFQAFLDSVMSVQNIASQFSSSAEATVQDRIITLSTCNSNSTQRFLVEAVLTSEI